MTISSPASQPTQDCLIQKKKVVYFVRHAEATHNIKEREAVQAARASGVTETAALNRVRRAVLQDESLTDAPLSPTGKSQVRRESCNLNLLLKDRAGDGYPTPQVVLVSPLRRTIMTALELFERCTPSIVAMEALRERRTGYAADERSPVGILQREFPNVDCSHLLDDHGIPKGEDNEALRERVRAFLEGPFVALKEDTVALVTHKAWLREMRHIMKGWVDAGQLVVHADLDQWDETLYTNAEVRVAEFEWDGNNKLRTIVSRRVEYVINNNTGSFEKVAFAPNDSLIPEGKTKSTESS